MNINDVILSGKIEINDTPVSRNDIDTRIINTLGNDNLLREAGANGLKEGAKFNIYINGDHSKPPTVFEILKVENTDGFTAAIIKDTTTGSLTNGQTFVWMDGSKGFNNILTTNPLEYVGDWAINDLLGIGSGNIYPQLQQLKIFVDSYIASGAIINYGIGQSLGGVTMSALAITEGYQDIQFRTYSGCVTPELRQTIANTANWGLNSANGSNIIYS